MLAPMIRLAASTLVTLISNMVALIVAALVLEGMTLSGTAFVVATLIFTGVELLISPLIRQTALTKAPVLLGSTALVASMIALLVTAVLNDGLQLVGLGTWAMAVVLVWMTGLAAKLLLPLVMFKKVLARNRPAAA
jgi:putative membrane protein